MIRGIEIQKNTEYDEITWRGGAACGDADPDLFHSDSAVDKVEARRICKGCSVAAFCLNDAIDYPDSSIRAGLTTGQRRGLRKSYIG